MNRAMAGVAAWFVALAVTPTSARADVNTSEIPARPTSIVGGTGFIRIDPPAESVQHFSNVLYLNRCDGGCTMTYGNENSSTNTSGVGSGYLPEFRWDDATWNDLVSCVREIFAPFDIVVVTEDPGTAEHMEAIIAGEACDLDGGGAWPFQCPYILGVAPFTCGYQYIPRSISYTFANDNQYGAGSHAQNVNNLCSTVGQEVAHTWGLDHELLASDPMTYLPYNGRRYFQDQMVNCGEYNGQPHGCGASVGCSGTPAQQNSVQRILARFGASNPTPPTITITSPADGAEVSPGFAITAEASEDLGRAELRIDNQLIDTDESAPYAFTAPGDLAEGEHRIEVRGYDLQDTPGSASIDVVVGAPCDDDDDCADAGENYTCVGGRCVPGEGTPGGLGEPCEMDTDCFSGLCLTSGADRYCVEPCDLAGDDCPGGFDCLDFDGGGVCWPAAEDGGGGCAASGTSANGAVPIFVLLALGGVLVLRRRRRS